MKRPTITDEIIRQAAMETAKKTANIDLYEVGQLTEAIVENYRHGMNGYELAREMEKNLDWDDIDSLFVDDMDAMGFNVDQIHRKICWQWVRDNDIQPPLAIGAEIKEGVITGICEHSPAYFLVKENGQDDAACGNRRRLIRFENAIAI